MKAPNQGILNRVKLIFYLGDFQASTYLENVMIKILFVKNFFQALIFSALLSLMVCSLVKIFFVFLAKVVKQSRHNGILSAV